MLRTAVKDLNRLRQITGIIGKYGYQEFVKKSPDLPQEIQTADFQPVDLDGADEDLGPRRFRMMLEELGPTFIKFGQVLSSRPDLVGREYIEELRTLQDNCEPLPFSSIEKGIKEGLSEPVEDLFDYIDPKPLGTASIAQVHRGRTKEGDEVVIKVQRPGINADVRADIDILYRIARLLDAVIAESKMTEPVGIVREFEQGLLQELDFRQEASNLAEFRRLHEKRGDVEIPKVFPLHSSSSVLTMAFLSGVPLSRLPEDADKKEIARRMVQEAFDEVFLDGVFHADPHPGNLMYLDDGRYGILDLGLLGRLTPQMQETIVVLALAISVRDADTIARTLYRLGQGDERVDIAEVRNDTVLVLNRYLDRGIQDIDSTSLLADLLGMAMKHQIRIPAEYTMLARAGATIEGIVREFDPEIDVAEVARPYAERLLIDRVAPDDMQQNLYKALLQFQGLSQDVPIQLSQILSDLSSGKFGVDVHGRSVERLNSTIMMAAATVAGAILSGAFVIGAFIGLAQLNWTVFGLPLVGLVGAVSGTLIFGWVIAYLIVRPRLKKISVLDWLMRRRH